jgi:hypothetical protein
MDRWKTGNGIESMLDGKAERQTVEQVMMNGQMENRE